MNSLLTAHAGLEAPTRRRLLAGALLGLALPAADAADTLTITAVSKTGGSGVAARLLADIYRRAGLALQIEVLPAARASLMTLNGKADGDLMRIPGYGQIYPQLVRVDPPFYRVTVRAYSLPARGASVQTREDLKHYSVGAVRGMVYAQELTENHPALTLTQNPLQLFRMLAAGRLDIAICTTLAAQSATGSLGLKDIDGSPDLVRLELHHYLHARRKEFAPRIAEAIRRMKDSGELDQLTAQYEAAATWD